MRSRIITSYKYRFVLLCMLSAVLVVQITFATPQPTINISTQEQIKDEFNSVPCKNEERLDSVKSLFKKMGAPESDITVEKYKDVENLVIRSKGESDEKIVIGAHYDKVSEGCGAIDNWTGIVTVAHLYKTLKDLPHKKTFLFVAFGKEEKGLVGSHAMVEGIKKEELGQYCDMINIDSLGLGAPQVATNMSSSKLEKVVSGLAKEMKIPYAQSVVNGADGDSSSFLARKIPALTLHGMNNDWRSILHSDSDKPAKVNSISVYLGYRLALALVLDVDEATCGAFK